MTEDQKAAIVAALDRPDPVASLGVLEHAAALGFSRIVLFRSWRVEKSCLESRAMQPEVQQEHLRLAGRQFAGQSDVQVPRLLPFSTEALTAMERVYGLKVTDPRAARPWRRPGLFLAAGRALLSRVLFSRDGGGWSVVFHQSAHGPGHG